MTKVFFPFQDAIKVWTKFSFAHECNNDVNLYKKSALHNNIFPSFRALGPTADFPIYSYIWEVKEAHLAFLFVGDQFHLFGQQFTFIGLARER